VTDHRVRAGKSVTSLLFGLVGTVLAVASCGSDTDSGKQPNTTTGGASPGAGGSVSTGGSGLPGSGGSTVGPGGGMGPRGGTANGGTVTNAGTGPGGAANGGTVTNAGTGPGGTANGGTVNGGAANGGTVSGGGTGGTPSGNNPPGYWTSGDWHGCVWTGIDTLASSTTTNTPKDFTAGVTDGAYCVSGSVHPDYDAVALLGFNLAEPAAGASCAYKPVDVNAPGPPAVSLSGAGIAVNFTKKAASTLRIQIQGPNGASDPNDRWCYTITDPAGPIFAPWNEFNTECWEGGMGTPPATSGTMLMEQISAVVFLVPGATAATPFDYCINGFATGTSAADAPTGGTPSGPLTGTIGGPGSTDLDFQRVKVKAGGKSYVIQNNNWGNPSGTDQTITYKDNSFKVVTSTGTKGGDGAPASFPSIFIGGNGDTQGGLYSTRSDDGLPKAISAIQTINTSFKYNRASGDYNATYDVWFAAPGSPQLETEYQDGISGFLMVWLYKPTGNFPISGGTNTPVRTGVTIPGVTGTWDVWVGPRGSGPSPNAPVISYTATSAVTSLTFDLKKFIDDSITNNHGLQAAWLLTDVFAGFEIWTGSAANGLELTEFTAVVQ
jgi:hypothetical protein